MTERDPRQTPASQSNSELDGLRFVFAGIGDTLKGALTRGGHLEVGQSRLASGQHQLAVNAFSESKDPEAIAHLHAISKDPSLPELIRSSAIHGLGDQGARTGPTQKSALDALTELVGGPDQHQACLAAVVLAQKLQSISNMDLHTHVGQAMIENFEQRQFSLTYGQESDSLGHRQLFCMVAKGLKDCGSANKLAELLDQSNDGFSQFHILEAMRERPHDELMHAAINRAQLRGDSGQQVKIAEGLTSAADSVRQKYVKE